MQECIGKTDCVYCKTEAEEVTTVADNLSGIRVVHCAYCESVFAIVEEVEALQKKLDITRR